MQKSKLLYTAGLPSLKSLNISANNKVIVFYDQKLLQFLFFKNWLGQFNYKIALIAGESLKSLNSYSVVLKKMATLPIHKNTTLIAVGGGSIGDFVGFVASTYKRGQRLIHIPSTWLSSIDSAHGGKTGLNFLGIKNQIGTFYPAEMVILSKKLLFSQPLDRVYDSYGEIFKIGLINQPRVFKKPKINADYLWQNLNLVIKAKYRIVEADPYEKIGLRQILNLGHTMGHVFESAHRIPHGYAVLLGLLFSARYSFHLGHLKQSDFVQICRTLFLVPNTLKYNKVLKISDRQILKALFQDKKKTSNEKVNFIFIRKIGKVFIQSIFISDLMAEIQRQRRQL